mgnify:CR=1 FL=1
MSPTPRKPNPSKPSSSESKRPKAKAPRPKPPEDGVPTAPPDACPAIRQVMMPRDTNALGTIFGGVILSMIDLAAAIEAHKHHAGKVVTVSMDQIEFKHPVNVGDLVSCYTTTERIGRSSIRARVAVWAQRRFGGGTVQFVTEGAVTMVAVDDKMRPVPIANSASKHEK